MKKKIFLLTICVILAGNLLYTQCQNRKNIRIKYSPLRIEFVEELYMRLVGLMGLFQNNTMEDYASYMDAKLLREVRTILAQLYGYASNVTQADEWQAIATKFLQLYVIHIGVAQANGYFYALEALDRDLTKPRSLQMLSTSQVSAQLIRYMNEEFRYPNITDPVLLYELMNLGKLPVTFTMLNMSPYFIVHLDWRFRVEGFADELLPEKGISYVQHAVYRNPQPLSPLQNMLNEVEFFLRAQASIKFLIDMNINNTLWNMYVDASIVSFSTCFLEKAFANYTIDRENLLNMRTHTLLQFYINFLEEEYQRINCHPIIEKITVAHFHEIVQNIIETQNFIHQRYSLFTSYIFNNMQSEILACGRNSLFQTLSNMNLVIGYSRRRSTGITFVDNREKEEPH